jgi:hypothetical protein
VNRLIDAVRENRGARAFLAGPGGFGLEWGGHVEPVRLAAGLALEG